MMRMSCSLQRRSISAADADICFRRDGRVGVDRMIEDASLARTVVVVLHNVADESRWQHLVGKSALVVEDSGVLNPHFAIDGSLVRDVVSIQYRGPRHEYACPPPGT
jgi:hypothetical protein